MDVDKVQNLSECGFKYVYIYIWYPQKTKVLSENTGICGVNIYIYIYIQHISVCLNTHGSDMDRMVVGSSSRSFCPNQGRPSVVVLVSKEH